MKKIIIICSLSTAMANLYGAAFKNPDGMFRKYQNDAIFEIGESYPTLSREEINSFIDDVNNAEEQEQVLEIRRKAGILNAFNAFKNSFARAKSIPDLIKIKREFDARFLRALINR